MGMQNIGRQIPVYGHPSQRYPDQQKAQKACVIEI